MMLLGFTQGHNDKMRSLCVCVAIIILFLDYCLVWLMFHKHLLPTIMLLVLRKPHFSKTPKQFSSRSLTQWVVSDLCHNELLLRLRANPAPLLLGWAVSYNHYKHPKNDNFFFKMIITVKTFCNVLFLCKGVTNVLWVDVFCFISKSPQNKKTMKCYLCLH